MELWDPGGVPDPPRRPDPPLHAKRSNFSGLVLDGAEAAVAAGVVDQRAAGRRVGRAGHGDHLADDDAVVTAVLDGEGPAFQRGQRDVEQRCAGDRAGVVRYLVELAFQRAAPGG